MSGARLEAKKIESAKDNEVLQYENSKRSWVSYRAVPTTVAAYRLINGYHKKVN